jgi:hypothetical protein
MPVYRRKKLIAAPTIIKYGTSYFSYQQTAYFSPVVNFLRCMKKRQCKHLKRQLQNKKKTKTADCSLDWYVCLQKLQRSVEEKLIVTLLR